MTARNVLNERNELSQLQEQTARNPYAGQDELTGEFCDQLYPFNDNICPNCAKKLANKNDFLKKQISNGKSVYMRGLCRLCGNNYMLPEYFTRVHLLVGRNTLKRTSRLDMFNNTNETRNKSRELTEKYVKRLSERYI